MSEHEYGDPELDRWIEERAAELTRERAQSTWKDHAVVTVVILLPFCVGAGFAVFEAVRQPIRATQTITSIGDPAPAAPLVFQDSSANEIRRIVDNGTTGTRTPALPPVTLHLGAGESYYNKVMVRDPVLSPVRFERGVRCVCVAVPEPEGVACETLLRADGSLEISLSPRQREFIEVGYACVREPE